MILEGAMYPSFVLLFSSLIFGLIMDRIGYVTSWEDDEGNEMEGSIYRIVLRAAIWIWYFYLISIGVLQCFISIFEGM